MTSTNHNPFEPPKADLDLPDAGAPAGEMVYAGFWRRFGAFWIDAAVMLPMSGLAYLLGEVTRQAQLYMLVPGLAIGLLYHVYLVRRFGGTPGKLLLKTRVAMLDGSAVTLKAASLRYSVLFVLSTLTSIAFVMASQRMNDGDYFALSYTARSVQMASLTPSWYGGVMVLMQIWVWGEFLVILFNRKRRAPHDFMAGTVVVRTASGGA